MRYKKRGLFLVVLGLFLVTLSFNLGADVAGCYYSPDASDQFYCINDVSKETAEEDCGEGCVIDDFFHQGPCSEVEQCDEVICVKQNDCLPGYSAGKCTAEGGTIGESECQTGCCKSTLPTGEFACNLFAHQTQCENFVSQQGSNFEGYFTNPQYTSNNFACKSLCDIVIQKLDLMIHLNDSDGNPINGATVKVDGAIINDLVEGKYFAPEVTQTSHTIEVEKADFITFSEQIEVNDNN